MIRASIQRHVPVEDFLNTEDPNEKPHQRLMIIIASTDNFDHGELCLDTIMESGTAPPLDRDQAVPTAISKGKRDVKVLVQNIVNE